MTRRSRPSPDYRDALEQTLIDAIDATRGRALVLFTSHALLSDMARSITEPLQDRGIVVLAQRRDGSPQQLTERLRRETNVAVLGTASFWEGVDVAGEALSLLVITRLPFTVPSDPVFAARSEAFEDAFAGYAVPQAVLRFKQGFGRLIRSSQDRGVCAVLDRRILTKRYGATFLQSLPECSVEVGSVFDLPSSARNWLEVTRETQPIAWTIVEQRVRSAMEQQIGRNLALELVRVTEAAALAAGRWMGRGQKEAADQAAVDAMRMVLNTIPMDGVVVIGEGAKDKAPMLFEGEHLGCADEPKTDIAVDPIDGTRLLSQGMANSISTVAVAERGSMFESPYVAYMDKIAVGPDAADAIDINASVANNLDECRSRAERGRPGPGGRHARPAAARGACGAGSRGWGADPVHHGRRRCRRGHGRDAGHRHRRLDGHRRCAGGRCRRLRYPLHRRRHAVQAVAAQRRRVGGGRCARHRRRHAC